MTFCLKNESIYNKKCNSHYCNAKKLFLNYFLIIKIVYTHIHNVLDVAPLFINFNLLNLQESNEINH